MGYKRRIGHWTADILAAGLRLGKQKTYRFFLDALWERYQVSYGDGPPLEAHLWCPDPIRPDAADRPLVERIFSAYRQAKQTQGQVDRLYQPSSMWKNILRTAYQDVTESLQANDIERFHSFLTNFGSWHQPTGIEESRLIRQCAIDRHKALHFEQKIMTPLIRWWLKFESDGRDLSALVMPNHGNFGGMSVNGHLISPGSVFTDVYARMIAGFLETDRPLIAELGGGFGRLVYFLSRHQSDFRYIGFDLPETLCCASYFLMKTFPEKRFLLYGEREWDVTCLDDFDFLLLPSFEISKLPDQCVDLFINENSLGELEAAACEHYVREICRTTKAFWHRNHECRRFLFERGTTSLLNREYPIPQDRFVRVVRYADLRPYVRSDYLECRSDMFWYYYRLRK